MKTKLMFYVLPVLALSFLFYSFTTTENAEKYNVNSVSSVSGANVLILIHDSTGSTTQRTADRDTLRKYIPQVVGAHTLVTFDSSSVLPDLTPYDFIIIQETSFDAAFTRYLGVSARTNLKNWLVSGTALNKKRLFMIGGDLGWNYSRAGSPGQDLDLSDNLSKFIYRVDNGPGSSSPSVEGTTIDIGNISALTSSPPGGSFWPDGCSMSGGGNSLYKYQNHTAFDTIAAIGNTQPTYKVASLFADPRYFAGGFGNVFEQIALWVNDNTPLPVELASFTSSVNSNNVTLNWTTSSEINNSGFDIERSSSEGQWTKIGNVDGNGTTSQSSSYTYTDKALATGKYSYRLKQIDFNGNFEYFNLSSEVNVGIPNEYKLSQNYPNPFNPSTTVEFALPEDGNVSITIFDMSGREVARLINEFKTAGYYSVNFNGSNLSSGVYLYTLNVTSNGNNFAQTKKMNLIK